MIKFESDHIIVGFIKNLLNDFKLPTPKVYNYDVNDYAVEGQLYIKDDYICQYRDNDFIQLFRFEPTIIPNNYYKKLKFTGINYDSHTHEYLGDYLRFIRDYKGLNLMPLYNCYSNRFPEDLYTKITINNEEYIIDSKDNNYKIIMVPVKLNQNYTIAIDNSISTEIFCGLYDTKLISTDDNKTLLTKTFKKIGSLKFLSPILYSDLTYLNSNNKDLYNYIEQNEKDLKLFIKLPSTNNSSITILEGNYLNFNDWYNPYFDEEDTTKGMDIFKKENNRSVLNFKPDFEDYYIEGKDTPKVKYADILKSSLQLLQMNSNISYPFADRLVEYLVDNVISSTDTISENIKRLQWLLFDRYKEGKKTTGIPSIGKSYGLWDDKYVAILYKLAIEENVLNTKTDILGYVDKDIEAKIGRYVDLQEKEGK